MAGIGFRLRKMLDQESYIDSIKAYFYAALISSGPWLISILVISLLGLFQTSDMSLHQAKVFRATIVYTYAFSLILIGLIQMPLTRYLADLLYRADTELYCPTYAAALLLTGVVQSLVGLPACFLFSGWTLFYALHAFILFQCVGFIWLAMLFLSTAKDYTSISLAFVAGGVLSVAAAVILGRRYGLNGYLAGYTIGQILIFLVLTLRILIEFRSDFSLNFDFLEYIRTYPTLLLSGFLYNLGIWADKFLFWHSVHGERVQGFLHASFVYDVPVFLAYLTVVPAMTLFLLRVETGFYLDYKGYYGAIVNKATFQDIMECKQRMIGNLKQSVSDLLKIQALVTATVILLCPFLIDFLHLSWLHVGIFRIATLAAFLHILTLFLVIGMFYFEFRLEAFVLTALFFLLNILGTSASIRLGLPWFGYGYFIAAFFCLAVGIIILDIKIRNLEYITFVSQPAK